MPPPHIDLCLLFRDDDRAKSLGPALWAALKEVEGFYNLGKERSTFARHFLAAHVPEKIRADFGADGPDWAAIAAAVRDEDKWEELQGRFRRPSAKGRARGTIDQRKLAPWVGGLVAASSRPARGRITPERSPVGWIDWLFGSNRWLVV